MRRCTKTIKINDNLYQGDANSAIEVSKNQKVDFIVYLAQELPEKLAFESLVPVIHIPLKDDGSNHVLSIKLAIANIILLVGMGKTLVSCRAGLSRSPTITAFVYAIENNISFLKSLDYMFKLNPSILPNSEFIETIREVWRKYYK